MVEPSDASSDIERLYALLSDSEKQKEIGSQLIKSLVVDILRQKLGWIPKSGNLEKIIVPSPWKNANWLDIPPPWQDITPPWIDYWRDSWPIPMQSFPETSRIINRITTEAKLSDEEKKIAKELFAEAKLSDEEKKIAKELGLL